MANLEKFWKTLELNADRSTIMHYWNAALGETLNTLKTFLHPTEGRVEFYPNPLYPGCHPYYVVAYRNGTFQAVSENRDHIIDLEPDNVVIYRWDMLRFRKLLAGVMEISPASDTIKKLDFTIRLGNLALAPGEECPVYLVLVDRRNFFKEEISRLLLKSKTPFIVVTGTRIFWDDELVEVLRERKIPLLPLCEALEFSDGQFVTTGIWYGAVEAFRQVLHPENMVAVPDYQFSRSEGWEFRFAGRKMIPNEDLLGFFYIQYLLRYPHEIIYAGELEKAASEQGFSRSAVSAKEVDGEDEAVSREVAVNHDDVLDREAREQYRQRLTDLAAQRCWARDHDPVREKEIDDEYQIIENELSNAKTIHGKTRNIDSSSRNLAKRVTKNINTAIEKIEAGLPDFAKYLRNTLHFGLYPFYSPHEKIDWHF